MYRKFLAAFVALVIGVGAIFAEEIKAVFVKYDEGKLTVKVDDKEKTYDVDKDATVKRKIKGEEKEIPLSKILMRYKADAKVIVTVEKDKVTDVKKDDSK